jgi:hypothetical protein
MESIRILKLYFQFMDLGSRYFGHLANTSRSELLLIILWFNTSYSVASGIIYELGTCKCAIRRLIFELNQFWAINIENYVDSTLLRHMYLSWLAKCLDQHRYTIGKPLLKTVGSSLGRHNWISVWTTEALHVILASVGPMQILQAQHWLNVGLRYLG